MREIDKFFPECAEPPLDLSCGNPELFRKYGRARTGICDGWEWDDKALKSATEAEKWMMVAIASAYWKKQYASWYDEMVNRLKGAKVRWS